MYEQIVTEIRGDVTRIVEWLGYSGEAPCDIDQAVYAVVTQLLFDTNRNNIPRKAYPVLAQIVARDFILNYYNALVMNADTTGGYASADNIKAVTTLETKVEYATGREGNTAANKKDARLHELQGDRNTMYWRLVVSLRKLRGL